jgi:hypothetical protein
MPVRKRDDQFARYAEEKTTTRQYTVAPKVVNAIRDVTPVYGSQGRALQVGTEILIRMKSPVKLSRAIAKAAETDEPTRLTYKLLPRTIQLIDELVPVYGDHGKVLAACVEVLRDAKTLS